MAKPVGVISKLKKNNNKHQRVAEEWIAAKRSGRPAQQWNEETKSWGKVMEPAKVTE